MSGGQDDDAVVIPVAVSRGRIAKAIADAMEEANLPPYTGDDYAGIGHPTTFRPMKNDLETINQYTEVGIGRIFRGEIGRYEQIRFGKQNQIPKGGAATCV